MTKAVTYNTFCNNYDEVSTLCHKYDEPVYITKDGKNDLVALSLEHYRKLTAHFDLLEELQKEENK